CGLGPKTGRRLAPGRWLRCRAEEPADDAGDLPILEGDRAGAGGAEARAAAPQPVRGPRRGGGRVAAGRADSLAHPPAGGAGERGVGREDAGPAEGAVAGRGGGGPGRYAERPALAPGRDGGGEGAVLRGGLARAAHTTAGAVGPPGGRAEPGTIGGRVRDVPAGG